MINYDEYMYGYVNCIYFVKWKFQSYIFNLSLFFVYHIFGTVPFSHYNAICIRGYARPEYFMSSTTFI